MANIEETYRIFHAHLEDKLGPNYIKTVQDILENYRVVKRNPILLRRKVQANSIDALFGLNPTGARFFYFKAALSAPSDFQRFSRYKTVKKLAWYLMLEHYHAASEAVKYGLFNLNKLYPSDLAKLADKNPAALRITFSSQNFPKALALTCIVPGFAIESLETIEIADPYIESGDTTPLLSKPLPLEPPFSKKNTGEEIDWNLIPD